MIFAVLPILLGRWAKDPDFKAKMEMQRDILLEAEMLDVLEDAETSAETTDMAKRHHDLVQALRKRVPITGDKPL